MNGCLGFLRMLAVMMVITCSLSSLLMQAGLIPQTDMRAQRSGVTIQPPTAQASKPDRENWQYGDFWMVDQVPCGGQGFVASVDASQGQYQVQFPSSF
jgi:hypothetical protein